VHRLAALGLISALLPALLSAAQHTGTVRAADQFLPGAMVTARPADSKAPEAKLVAYTDENGRYTMNLPPGEWDIQVEAFGFTPVRARIKMQNEPNSREWTLDMPKFGQPKAGPAGSPEEPLSTTSEKSKVDAPKPATAPTEPRMRRRPDGQGPGARGPGRGAPPGTPGQAGPGGPQRPGFQNAQVTATQDGQQALADAANNSAGMAAVAGAEEADESFIVGGSTSGGLGASSDQESMRQRMMASGPGGRGGPGGPGGGPGGDGPGGNGQLGLPPGMSVPGSDGIGLGGLGANAINGGFGPGAGGIGGDGPGGPGGPGGFGGPGGRGGPGGGGGGGRGGGGGGGGPRGGRGQVQQNRRGPFNGQYANFGNKKRAQQPPLSGSINLNLNNSVLNAAPFSLNGQAAPKPSYAQARFGAQIGGPLVIPKLIHWTRASFFLSYQGNQSRNPYSQIASVPTALERGGDFSLARTTSPVTLFDPLNGQPFGGNLIPAMRISSVAIGLLKFIPQQTYNGIVQNYQLVTSTPNTSNSVSARLNAPLSRKDRLNFNVQVQQRDSKSQQLFGFKDESSGSGLSSSVGWSHSFKPRVNNSATITLSRNNTKNAPFFAYRENVAGELGITGTSQDPINYGPPNLSFTNFGSLSDGTASVTRNQTINFTDNVTYIIKKKHNLTFGGNFIRLQQNSLSYQNARGAFSFSGLLTSQLDSKGNPINGTGFDFADFLLGLPQSSSLRFGSDNNYFRGWSTAVYAQDDYRILRGLSINLGLRYEFFSPYTELHNHLANLDINSAFTQVAVVTAGQNGVYNSDLPTSLVRPDRNNLSPRFGFAWRPTAKNSTVIRGGYSIFYSGSSYAQIATQLASQPPFATTASLSTSTANVLTLLNGFPSVPSQNVTNTYAIDPNFKLAYAQTWNLALQRSLPHAVLVELEYIGTKGTDLGVVEQPNRAAPGSVLTAQQRLQIGNATGFNYQTWGANSSFQAGQVRVTRRFTRGVSANALYTYSKAIDDASSFSGTGGTVVQFIDNLHNERGLSSFDQRHRITTGYVLSSPVGVHGLMRNGGWKTHALSGWTLNGNFTASSGTPLTARVSGNLANTGGTGAFGSSRAEATGLPIDGGNNFYFNPAAFTTPAAGFYGNAGRNTIPGLFQMSLNASINRAFRFGESRRQLQLRLSATNALNHVIVTSIGTTVNSSTYGLPTAASATRTVQLLLRFSF
jgi:hypothetical protein